MANIRCPMCSKLNTPDAEVCVYCGARLKPVRPSSPAPDPGAPGAGDADEPDWLRSLRAETPGSGQEEPAGAEAEEGEEPDWLARIRSRSAAEQQDRFGEQDADDDDTPDWLKGLQDTGQPAGDDTPGEETAGVDWFGRLQDAADQPETTAADQPEAQPPQENADNTPDWLRGLAEETFSEQPSGDLLSEFPSETGQAAEDEDWVNMLSAWSPEQAEKPQEQPEGTPLPGPARLEDEDFSWLADEAQEPGPVEAEARQEEEGESFGLTGFLSSLDKLEAGETASPETGESFTGAFEEETASEGLPDWLAGQPSGEAADEASSAAGETVQSPEGLPDWLQGFEETAPSQEPEAPEQDAPAWLYEEQQAELPADSESAAGDLPSWLAGADAVSPAAGDEESQPSPDEAEISEWMRAEDTALPESPPAEEPQAAEGLPDWFASFDQAAAEEETATAGEQAVAGPVDTYPFTVDEPQAETETAAVQPGEGEVPDWLREFEAQQPVHDAVPPLLEEEPAEPAPALEGDHPFSVDLPDWLSEDEVAEAETAEQPAEMAGEPLAQADLPEWVKEMRPIESIIPGELQIPEVERRAEKSGPLAGLPGILPAEELAVHYRRPPVYSVKLRASEKQRAQAAQFETILTQEMQPLLIPPQGRRVQALLVRVLIALVLLVGLAVPPVMAMEPLTIPALGPEETRHMFEELDTSLQQDDAVLLAVDFEPALAGEMRLAAQPVIEHLLSRNPRVVVAISTRPAGPALAQQLVENTAANYPGFDQEQNFVNLGYLPGDMISLLAFARQPAFTAPANLGGELVWDAPALQDIHSIQDFSTVIVLTDSAETGRIWVEQVQPLMGDVPLLMVTSSQAGPMMAPFVQSGQVTGMVSGMIGGFIYSQWAGQADTPAAGYLASYQFGVLLAFALALLGGLFSGATALIKRGEKDED